MIATLLPGEARAPCSGAGGGSGGVAGVDRTVLINLAPPHSGSTALLQFVMSNPAVSSLCRGNMWACEGVKLGIKFTAGDNNAFMDHMANWTALSGGGEVLEASFLAAHNAVKLSAGLRLPIASRRADGMFRTPATIQLFTEAEIKAKVARALGGAADVMPTEVSVCATIWDTVATWARIWDLQKPVLVEKTPAWFWGAEELHNALLRYPGSWPLQRVRSV